MHQKFNNRLIMSCGVPMQSSLILLVLSGSCLHIGAASAMLGCAITDFGARGGNLSAYAEQNTAALTKALKTCTLVTIPTGTFKIYPVEIPSHRILHFNECAVLVASENWTCYGKTRFLPPMGAQMQIRPLLSANNASNITIRGMNGTIDGNGWAFWPWANWSSPVCGMHKSCAPRPTFGPEKLIAPYLIRFVRCSNIVLDNITFTNPAFWGIEHFFCNKTSISNVTILAPHWTREIAGFMPYAVREYRVEDSYVLVGDDAVAIMSGADEAGVLWPSVDLNFYRLVVEGRSVAIGSAVFGNVTDVLFEDCTIGNSLGSCPWAIKIKMHANFDSVVKNIAFRSLQLGNISSNTWQDPGSSGGTAIHFGTNYGRTPVDPTKPQPHIENVSFVNVTAIQTKVAGALLGGVDGGIVGIHFIDCDFRATSSRPWVLKDINLSTCSSDHTSPPFINLAKK